MDAWPSCWRCRHLLFLCVGMEVLRWKRLKELEAAKREPEGKRAGAKAGSEQRKQRQTRAHDDEWELIKRFERVVKQGSKACLLNL